MNILIVDDNENFANQLKRSLLRTYSDVELAVSLEEAQLKVLKSSFTHIILDIELGVTSGLKLFETTKNLQHPPKVIIMTAYSKKEYAIEALNNQAFYYLEKPVRTEQLIEIIGKEQEKNSLILNPDFNTILYQDQEIHLTQTEFDILSTFLANKNKVISKEKLHQAIYKNDVKAKNIINTHLLNLKNKLPCLKDNLKSVRGKGYIYYELD